MRKKLKLSQEALGRLLGVCLQTVYLWEHGLVVPGTKRESTQRLISLIDEYGLWEEGESLINHEGERVQAWHRRVLKKSSRLKKKGER